MTSWVAPPRTPAAREVYEAAENDRAAHPDKYRLGVEAVDRVVDRASRGVVDRASRGVVERASGGGGGEIFGDPGEWRPGLIAYLGSAAEDGRLNALGARTVQGTVVGRLIARASIAEYLDNHPEVGNERLAPPIVITGGWRTGTTYLFRLLARDPRLRAPLPAELAAPWQLAGDLEPQERTARLEASAAGHRLLHLLNPAMAAVHDSGPELAEECVLGMGTTMRNWGFTATTRLDSYATWLAGECFAEEYRQHRRILQILDGRDGRRWVLKAPAHVGELEHVIATYPGACVVQLHRDIVETIASGASLFATYRSTYSDHVDGADIGRFQSDQTELWLRRAAVARKSPAAQSVTWVDLHYTDLVADPDASLRRIYAAAGLDIPDTAAMIARHNSAEPRDGKGKHRYAAEQFGIDPGELRERMRFYTETVPPVSTTSPACRIP